MVGIPRVLLNTSSSHGNFVVSFPEALLSCGPVVTFITVHLIQMLINEVGTKSRVRGIAVINIDAKSLQYASDCSG